MRKVSFTVEWERISYFVDEVDIEIPVSVPLTEEEAWAKKELEKQLRDYRNQPNKYDWEDEFISNRITKAKLSGKEPFAPTPGQIEINEVL